MGTASWRFVPSNSEMGSLSRANLCILLSPDIRVTGSAASYLRSKVALNFELSRPDLDASSSSGLLTLFVDMFLVFASAFETLTNKRASWEKKDPVSFRPDFLFLDRNKFLCQLLKT
jgi:hypothetical protein